MGEGRKSNQYTCHTLHMLIPYTLGIYLIVGIINFTYGGIFYFLIFYLMFWSRGLQLEAFDFV